MTPHQWAELAAAVLGATGTLILFVTSYVDRPLEGAVWGGPMVTAANENIRAEDAWNRRWQRAGIGLLMLSFIVQIVAALAL
jgi:hypothetical protein